ncbi:MAG: threonine/serine dehydratase [Chloroflexi bacterium]|jgi:threonine dehydratase|nr:threonine/serine dehydratase [Chloroflexota bacterium]
MNRVQDHAAPAETCADLVTLDEIRAAAERLRGVTVRTPLLPFGRPLPGDPLGRPGAWLKPESLQPIGAFKLRGAYNAIAQLPGELRAAGVVTHSSGNHAQGVARAARLLGVRAVIVMPADAPRTKRERVAADSAEIVVVGTSSEERASRALELAQRDGLTLVPPYDDRTIVCGQATVGLEIVEQLVEMDTAAARFGRGRAVGAGHAAAGFGTDHAATGPGARHVAAPLVVLVPIGGGGLAAGVSTAVKSLCPDATVLGVEPSLAADARDSLREGRIVRWEPEEVGRTSADGMRTASVGRIPFAHLRRFLDGVIAVEEVEIARAMVRAAHESRLVLEPSGATALAALLFHLEELPQDARIVAVLSGGNIDPERYEALIATGTAAGG